MFEKWILSNFRSCKYKYIVNGSQTLSKYRRPRATITYPNGCILKMLSPLWMAPTCHRRVLVTDHIPIKMKGAHGGKSQILIKFDHWTGYFKWLYLILYDRRSLDRVNLKCAHMPYSDRNGVHHLYGVDWHDEWAMGKFSQRNFKVLFIGSQSHHKAGIFLGLQRWPTSTALT